MRAAARRLDQPGGDPRIVVTGGHARAIDAVAGIAGDTHHFLRRSWYEAAGGVRARTIAGLRADGSAFAALPLVAMGPPMLGMTMVPGSYWPFRSPVIAADAGEAELRALVGHPQSRSALGQAWRIGPVYAEDEGVRRLAAAACAEGWIRLTRPLGTTFVVDVAGLRATGEWPTRSAARKVARLERQLMAQGRLQLRFVRGRDWDDAALDALAEVEAASWVGQRTDGSGAKFLSPAQRGYWETVLADSELAGMLSAAILRVGDEPVAFSFDLNVGPLQYGLASSYDSRFAPWSPGRLVTWRHIAESEARGIERIDWGSGDSGYKREFGAVPGSEIVDLLFVRSRPLAAVLRGRWCGAGGEVDPDARRLLSRREQLLLAALATAAAAATLAE